MQGFYQCRDTMRILPKDNQHKIIVLQTAAHGLELFKIYLDSDLQTARMSEAGAMHYAQKLSDKTGYKIVRKIKA
jgi:hypothetical protein